MSRDKDQEEARELIASIVDETGLSATAIARGAGVAPSTLTRLYPNPLVKYTLSARTLAKLRHFQHAARSTQEDLPTREEASSLAVREIAPAFMARPEASIGLHIFKPYDPPTDSLPTGSELELLKGNLIMPVQRVASPLGHGGDDRYLLTYMADDSMAPRFKSGDYLLIDRIKPPTAGGEVLVVFTDNSAAPDVLACIALLVERNRSQIRLKQYAGDVVATVMRRDVAQTFAIVGSFDDLP